MTRPEPEAHTTDNTDADTPATPAGPPEESGLDPAAAMARAVYRLYRDFFDLAERRRRWSLQDDIPWEQCNPQLNPAVADVVESFCVVELYLPDYVAKMLPLVRADRGRAWFAANWGY